MAIDDGDGKIEHYAGFAYAQETGTQALDYGQIDPDDDLSPYGCQEGGDYDSSPDNATPAGPRNAYEGIQHSRATAAQAPPERGSTFKDYDGGRDGRDGLVGTRREDMPRLPTPTDVY